MSFDVPATTTKTVGMLFVLSLDGATVANQVGGWLEVQAGSNLSYLDCNDALEPGMEPVVSQQWAPVAGTATMEVTALTGEAWTGGPMTFSGEVSLSGVTVELVGNPGTICELPDATWTNQSFGWLPG